MLKEKIHLEDKCLANGGDSPSTQVPCLKSTALTLTFQPTPRPHPPPWPSTVYNNDVNNPGLLDPEQESLSLLKVML